MRRQKTTISSTAAYFPFVFVSIFYMAINSSRRKSKRKTKPLRDFFIVFHWTHSTFCRSCSFCSALGLTAFVQRMSESLLSTDVPIRFVETTRWIVALSHTCANAMNPSSNRKIKYEWAYGGRWKFIIFFTHNEYRVIAFYNLSHLRLRIAASTFALCVLRHTLWRLCLYIHRICCI